MCCLFVSCSNGFYCTNKLLLYLVCSIIRCTHLFTYYIWGYCCWIPILVYFSNLSTTTSMISIKYLLRLKNLVHQFPYVKKIIDTNCYALYCFKNTKFYNCQNNLQKICNQFKVVVSKFSIRYMS